MMNAATMQAVQAAITYFNGQEKGARLSPQEIEAAVNSQLQDTPEKKAKHFKIENIIKILKKTGFVFTVYRTGSDVAFYVAETIPEMVVQPEKKVKTVTDPNAPKRGRGRPKKVVEPVVVDSSGDVIADLDVSEEMMESHLDTKIYNFEDFEEQSEQQQAVA